MLDPKNTVQITGGVVADPEQQAKRDGTKLDIWKLRVAVDYAGRDQENPDNKSGYFDVTVYTGGDDRNTKFVKDQLTSGKLKKGSQIQLVGRLEQDRFKTNDGKNASRVGIVAEAITYASGGGGTKAEGSSNTGPATAVATEF